MGNSQAIMKVFLALLVLAVIAGEAKKDKGKKCVNFGLCEKNIIGYQAICCDGYECKQVDADNQDQDKFCVRTMALSEGDNCSKFRGACGEGLHCCNRKCQAEECAENEEENNKKGPKGKKRAERR